MEGGAEAELLGSRNGDAVELLVDTSGPVGQKPLLIKQVGKYGMAVASKSSSTSTKRASLR